ncbi:hypothetical protein Tco_1549536 [Tanacetum coccineum]|uniref:Uncharacterized protein n=1 Tax=Tanacetum coccineum TaxID=301880 RepID=A0ABQ4ZQW2_9ASTR
MFFCLAAGKKLCRARNICATGENGVDPRNSRSTSEGISVRNLVASWELRGDISTGRKHHMSIWNSTSNSLSTFIRGSTSCSSYSSLSESLITTFLLLCDSDTREDKVLVCGKVSQQLCGWTAGGKSRTWGGVVWSVSSQCFICNCISDEKGRLRLIVS